MIKGHVMVCVWWDSLIGHVLGEKTDMSPLLIII